MKKTRKLSPKSDANYSDILAENWIRANIPEWRSGPRNGPRKHPDKNKVYAIKKGDKLFLVTRRDISGGYQAVQSCHALRQFGAEHPDVDAEWYTVSNYLALLSVENEVELMKLITRASDLKLKWSAFREPDVGGMITAIAIEPGPKSQALCKSLPLALKID